jgi:hypothetical protein
MPDTEINKTTTSVYVKSCNVMYASIRTSIQEQEGHRSLRMARFSKYLSQIIPNQDLTFRSNFAREM